MSWMKLLQSALFHLGRLNESLRSRYWKKLILNAGGEVGPGFLVKRGAHLSFPSRATISIGPNVTLADGAAIYVGDKGKLKLGSGVFVGRGSVLVANCELEVGEGTQIAHFVTIIDTDHRFDRRDVSLLHQGEVSAPIRIGTQVWIAAHSIILKGRTLGDHCVVGAGAVVTRDVAPGEVAVGNPAKPL